MEQVVTRLQEQWEALDHYICKAVSVEKPRHDPKKPSPLSSGDEKNDLKLYYTFLAHILSEISSANVLFQSENVRLHSYLTTIEAGLKKFFRSS